MAGKIAPRWRCERTITDNKGREVLLGFAWHGGPYIEVGERGLHERENRWGGQTELWTHMQPKDVINVWDYYNDQPRIEREQRPFEARVDEWINQYPADSLVHDVIENWRYF